MAEERLIDDDKDRKYRIIKNADGEDELVIDDSPESDEDELSAYQIPVYDVESEDEEILTPDELARRELEKAEEEKAAKLKFAELIANAKLKLDEGDYESAQYAVSLAEDIDAENAETHCLKLRALTRDFTYFYSLEQSENAAEKVREFASETQKAELESISAQFKDYAENTRLKAEELKKLNEEGKASRRAVFAEKCKKTAICFAATAIPFLIGIILTVIFASIIFSAENGAFIIATAVCGGISFMLFVAAIVTAKLYWTAKHNVIRNENDNSTKVGREYIAAKDELEKLNIILGAFVK